jgi:hypothetical protein
LPQTPPETFFEKKVSGLPKNLTKKAGVRFGTSAFWFIGF